MLGARRARVSMKREPSGMRVTVTDEGRRFDWRAFLEFDAGRAFDLNGRGIAIARRVAFDSLECFGRGNVAVVTVSAA